MSPLTFDELILRARADDQDALRIFAERYGRRIRGYVRHHLDPRVRPHFDEDDGMDSVLWAFFRSALLRKTFADEAAMLAYLRRMSEFLIAKENRHYRSTAKWNVNHQVPLPPNLPASIAPPDLVAEVHDAWEHFLAGLEPRERQVFILRSQGFTFEEISDELDLTIPQIRHILSKWRHSGDTDASA